MREFASIVVVRFSKVEVAVGTTMEELFADDSPTRYVFEDGDGGIKTFNWLEE